MPGNLRIKDVERMVVDVPFTPRCQEWNAREVWQWRVVEVIRVTTDSPELVGYGETILTNGSLELASVRGFLIEVEWLFADEKPDEFTVTKHLIEAA